MRPCFALFLCTFLLVFQALRPAPASASPETADATAKALEAAEPLAEETATAAPRFEIKRYEVAGTQLYSRDVLSWTLHQFTGPGRSGEDVEAARAYLQREFERVGYPTLIVIIPEQTISDGIVKLEVIEGTIGEVRVVGNKHYSEKWLKGFFPDLKPGKPLNQPEMARALEKVNRNPNHQVAAVLSPGKDPRTTDLELRVQDRSPWHGRVELNNYATPETPDLRTLVALQYSNLWGREHVVTGSWQTSPQDTDAVKAYAGSYFMPLPWWGHSLTFYGAYSDSQSVFQVPDISVLFGSFGKGKIFGARYVMPLWDIGDYEHKITLGVDYQDLEQSLVVFGTQTAASPDIVIDSPVRYMPFLVGYNGELTDPYGVTALFANLNFNFANILPDLDNDKAFEARRPGSSANYVYATLGISRTQRLWRNWTAYVEVDGQVANGPLIDSEAFRAGGIESVRGFKEQVLLGDEGFHGTAEIRTPLVPTPIPRRLKSQLQFVVFSDNARLSLLSTSKKTSLEERINSLGAGVRFSILEKLFVKFDYGWPVNLNKEDQSLDPGAPGLGNFTVFLQF
ncbi:MAG: ShlB/FhaC/HecB family hemolysin secretion/activation protein [Deltaproteobacteria bacterium]|nr:ShlB/FhaC/HecB family hemolysin secretion/activation protein [Deltaproteobacteria bacterium]